MKIDIDIDYKKDYNNYYKKDYNNYKELDQKVDNWNKEDDWKWLDDL